MAKQTKNNAAQGGFKKPLGVLVAVAVGIGLTVQVLLGIYNLKIMHAPEIKGVALGLVGPSQVTDVLKQQLGQTETFKIADYADRSAAEQAVKNRDAYGALVVGLTGNELLISNAASPLIAQILTAAFTSQPSPLPTTVTDVVPLSKNDTFGASFGSLVQVLLIGGLFGAIAMFRLLPARGSLSSVVNHLGGLAAYAVLSAVAVLLVAQGFGVIETSDFWKLLLPATVVSFAVAATTSGLVHLLGLGGVAISVIAFFLLGVLVSGAGVPPEALPSFWRSFGENIPTGAGLTLLKNTFYFGSNATTQAWTVLVTYGVLGAAAVYAGSMLKAKK